MTSPLTSNRPTTMPWRTNRGAPQDLFNVCRVVDALDEDASELHRFPSSGRVMKVSRYAFEPTLVADLTAFRIPQDRTLFLAGHAVATILGAGLSGADFQPVWPLESPLGD